MLILLAKRASLYYPEEFDFNHHNSCPAVAGASKHEPPGNGV